MSNDASLKLPVAILAGGLATRLRPFTEKVPKLLVEVAGEPFFSHQLRLLKQAGARHLVVCAGYLGEMIVEQYGDGRKWGMHIEYSFDGPKLLGTGGALIRALPLLGEAFHVLYGDSYLPIDYKDVENAFYTSKKNGLMTVYKNSDRHDVSNVWFENNAIKAYDKRNKIPEMQHIDYGLGVLHSKIFESYSNNEIIDLADIYTKLVADKNLAGYESKKRFYEIGSHSGLQELDKLLASGAAL